MNKMSNDLLALIDEDFERDLDAVLHQMPTPPENATPEQIIRHTGAIFHRLAFLRGLAVGVETSQVYIPL